MPPHKAKADITERRKTINAGFFWGGEKQRRFEWMMLARSNEVAKRTVHCDKNAHLISLSLSLSLSLCSFFLSLSLSLSLSRFLSFYYVYMYSCFSLLPFYCTHNSVFFRWSAKHFALSYALMGNCGCSGIFTSGDALISFKTSRMAASSCLSVPWKDSTGKFATGMSGMTPFCSINHSLPRYGPNDGIVKEHADR